MLVGSTVMVAFYDIRHMFPIDEPLSFLCDN